MSVIYYLINKVKLVRINDGSKNVLAAKNNVELRSLGWGDKAGIMFHRQ